MFLTSNARQQVFFDLITLAGQQYFRVSSNVPGQAVTGLPEFPLYQAQCFIIQAAATDLFR